MSDLERAISIALEKHKGQTDKSGAPYILHPPRLMMKFDSELEQIVAILHDTIEDSDLAINDLETANFSQEVVFAIDCLTKRQGESYEAYIKRVLSNSLASKIRIEDLKDNLKITRLENITEKDITRIKKYHNTFQVIMKTHPDC
ncbi:hypothetical protein [Marinobacter mangrovi]|uniref:hypothetical protein n=1 Tax=Marinobacter mangrovi TaxID=2803918 RepID=UPI0019330A3E|nr:hypothetical protein [Marinobacter mangrovi]